MRSKFIYSFILVLVSVFFLSFSRPVQAAWNVSAAYPINPAGEVNFSEFIYDATPLINGNQNFVFWDNYDENTSSGGMLYYYKITAPQTTTEHWMQLGSGSYMSDPIKEVKKIDHDSNGNLYVVENYHNIDHPEHKLHKFNYNSNDNSYSFAWTKEFQNPEAFWNFGIGSVAVDKSNNEVYVALYDNDGYVPSKLVRIATNGDEYTFFTDDINGTSMGNVIDMAVHNNRVYTMTSWRNTNGESMVFYKCTAAGGTCEDGIVPYSSTNTSPGISQASTLIIDHLGQVYVIPYLSGYPVDAKVYDVDGNFLNTSTLSGIGGIKAENNKIYIAYYWGGYEVSENDITAFGALPTNTPTATPTATASPSPTETPTTKKIILPAELNGVLTIDGSTDAESIGSNSANTVLIKFTNNRPLAEITNDFAADYDWSTITSGEDIVLGKSFVHGLVGQDGAASSFTLYIPIPAGMVSNSVAICSGASSLSAVTNACADVRTINSAGVSKETVAGVNYWKVSGLTGTGGIALIDSFDVNDTLTREKINTTSNHLIHFGTVNGLLASTDTLVLDFGSSWNFGALSVTDIDLLDDGTNLTLGSSQGASTWGVAVNAGTGVITFTAPTSSGYIAAGSIIDVKIGTNAVYGTTGSVQIINPATVGSYSLVATITNGSGTESAAMNIPIVDSDQVNVLGFVNTFINFDIDTAIIDEDCDYNSCLTHENGTAGTNYTVDLGELNSAWVNSSNSTAVDHLEGGMGVINSIWFNLTTNAWGGAMLSVTSANGGLQGPSTNLIASVPNAAPSNDTLITANSGKYGFNLGTSGTGNGTIAMNSNCNDLTHYCALQETPITVFNTANAPLDNGRARMDIAAAAAYTNNPGSYTDTLTFIVVATY